MWLDRRAVEWKVNIQSATDPRLQTRAASIVDVVENSIRSGQKKFYPALPHLLLRPAQETFSEVLRSILFEACKNRRDVQSSCMEILGHSSE